jgi:hypothetical protein
MELAKNSWVGLVPSHEQAKQNFKVAMFFLWKILGYLQILVWLIHTKVQVCVKEYQTLPFFDGIFATVFGQFCFFYFLVSFT